VKILIDIGHPAHVHYFKYFISEIKDRGHKIFLTARDKEITHYLIKYYGLEYTNRGKGGKKLIGKLLYIFYGDYLLYKISRKLKPDLYISFGSPYAAHVSALMKKPHIAFDDTEHAKFGHLMYVPFTDIILTPSCFYKEFGKKHVRFNGYMELCYLHPNYFRPDPSVLNLLGVKEEEKYVILRFVSWDAAHDIGQYGITLELKRYLVDTLSKKYKMLISSEGELPEDLKKYSCQFPTEKIHDVLAHATLYVGEGATMASECAMLGTPAIYVNSLTMGYLEELEKNGLMFSYRNSKGVLEKVIELMEHPNLRKEWEIRREKMLSEKIDVTAFMVWLIENYPKSVAIMKENPDYQNNFRSTDFAD